MISQVISFEQMEFSMFRKLSDCLGLSFPEIIAIAPVLFPVTTSENIIKGYLASFDPAAPEKIFKKIKNLSAGCTVFLGYYLINDILPEPLINN